MQKRFYVSVIRTERPSDYRLLAGPYELHETALGLVDKVRAIAERVDPRACWYAFGTCSLEGEGEFQSGILNDLLAAEG